MKNHVFLEHAYLARRLVKRHVLKTKISPYAPIPSRRHAWVNIRASCLFCMAILQFDMYNNYVDAGPCRNWREHAKS